MYKIYRSCEMGNATEQYNLPTGTEHKLEKNIPLQEAIGTVAMICFVCCPSSFSDEHLPPLDFF